MGGDVDSVADRKVVEDGEVLRSTLAEGRTRAGRDWNSAETALALLLCFWENPARLGGTKRTASGSHQNSSVTALANLLGRTEDSVVMKVMNLRAEVTQGRRGMSHAGATAAHMVLAFRQDLPGLLLAVEMLAARVPGVPEYLETLSTPRPRTEGARSPSETQGDDPPQPITEVLRERAERRGQDLFRRRVLANYDHTCCFCGLRSRLPDVNSFLLVASHIKPWSNATGNERLDFRNGLTLCPVHDRAFDYGFLSVDDDLRIVASGHTREHYAPEHHVHEQILCLHGQRLFHPKHYYTEPERQYLEFHRHSVFEQRFRQASEPVATRLPSSRPVA